MEIHACDVHIINLNLHDWGGGGGGGGGGELTYSLIPWSLGSRLIIITLDICMLNNIESLMPMHG